jgi:hypothetical protein
MPGNPFITFITRCIMTTRYSVLFTIFVAVAMTDTSAEACWRTCCKRVFRPCRPAVVQYYSHPCQPGFSARPKAITEACNRAPGTGYYVKVFVFSNGQTWYYGPYSTYADANFVSDSLYNPSTQWTSIPIFIDAAEQLQPWTGTGTCQ